MRNPPQSAIPEYKQKPGLLFQPDVYRRMQRGINHIVDAVRPTLGPLPRSVAIQPASQNNKSPELLDNGALIARRIIDLPDASDNIGAMFTRAMLWRLNEQVGDGTATAAVLFQSVFNASLRYIAAGGNAMRLRLALEQGMLAILDEIDRMAQPVEGRGMLTRVASSVCPEPAIAAALGEIFHIIGEYGRLEIRSGHGRELKREYITGSYWPGGLASSHMVINQAEKKTELLDAALLLSDLEIEEPQELVPVFKAAYQAGVRALCIIARKFSDRATGLLVSSLQSDKMQGIGVKTPGLRSDDQMHALQDLAALTGGRPFFRAAGESFANVRPEDFGRARSLWADMNFLGISGGKGDPRRLRQWVAGLRQWFANAEEDEPRQKTLQRIGALSGGTAVLHVGGKTEAEITTRKELATRASQAVRAALREGVLNGGGTALLACRPRLQRLLKASRTMEEHAACKILLTALEAPFRTLLQNAGEDPGAGLARLHSGSPGLMVDVIRGQIVDAAQMGVLDPAAVQRAAVHSAVRSAALALTIDVFVQRRKPPLVVEPD